MEVHLYFITQSKTLCISFTERSGLQKYFKYSAHATFKWKNNASTQAIKNT